MGFRKIVVAPIVFLALLLFAASAMAQGSQDFNLTNKTGYDIHEVYVSPSNEESWEEDVLDQDILSNGQSVIIRFPHSPGTCVWDLLVVYDDGEQAEWEDFDLCKTSKINIHYNRKSGETWAEYQ